MKLLNRAFSILNLKFLYDANQRLMIHYPRLWASKIFYVLFYGIAGNILVAIFVLTLSQPQVIQRRSGRFTTTSNILTWSVFVIEMFIFAYWFYKQSHFNVEENYGQTHYAIGIFEILIYSICIFIITSSSLTALILGIYKTTKQMNINQSTVCEGTSILSIYSPDYFEDDTRDTVNQLQTVFALTKAATIDHVANEGQIWIEAEAITLEGNELYTYYANQSFSLGDWNHRSAFQVEGPESEVSLLRNGKTLYPISLIIDGIPRTISNENESFLLKSGDIVLINARMYPILWVRKDKLSGRRLYEMKLRKGDILIQEQGTNLAITPGEATVWTDGYTTTWLQDSAYYACLHLKYFFTNKKLEPKDNPLTKNDPLFFYGFVITHFLFIVLATMLLIALKHSNWKDLAVILLVFLIQIIPLIFLYFSRGRPFASVSDFLYFLENSISYLNRFFFEKLTGIKTSGLYDDIEFATNNNLILTITTAIFILLQIRRVLKIPKMKSYNRIAFLRFISLPIDITIIVTFIILVLPLNYIETIVILPLFFMTYLIYAPIQKKLFIHLISLPKDN
jgi:hypothetical protein